MHLIYYVRSGKATGGLNPPLSSRATHDICAEPIRKYWGTPTPRNVVPTNTLVLVSLLSPLVPRAKPLTPLNCSVPEPCW